MDCFLHFHIKGPEWRDFTDWFDLFMKYDGLKILLVGNNQQYRKFSNTARKVQKWELYEDLIQWGWPEDVWFHVDNYSSAHVYLRLAKGQTIDDIPKEVLTDAAQLVKANSIQGNKVKNIEVVYTLWENLKKTPGMEVGQVSFFSEKAVRKIHVDQRINEIINRLNKTKTEDYPDLRLQKEQRDTAEKAERKRNIEEQKKKEKEEERQKQTEIQKNSYSNYLKPEHMTSNYDNGNDSDDFM